MTEDAKDKMDVEIVESSQISPLEVLIKNVTSIVGPIVAEMMESQEDEQKIAESNPRRCRRCGAFIDGLPCELNVPDQNDATNNQGISFKRYDLCRDCSVSALKF